MTKNLAGQQLHNRFTQGEKLSTDERSQLEEWYAAQDRIETDQIAHAQSSRSSADLQSQIDATLAQLAVVTKRMQELTAENETLRQEVLLLRRQVPQLV
jgi:chromosome segregation ATPase